ncbi:SHOCT domain-containing protein [Mycobacterium sp. NBC_00419]|uniref:SHOCT domain-containing protein n=1 Tax=Mycobacterium sp. NBC_00419 TaxID=2975989 RepID=UPI002E20877B
MKGTWSVSRIMAVCGIITMLVGGIGFIIVMALNAFVLDEFDAYGEVPIPGSGQVELPAGEVQISFHTSVTGSTSGSFPVPALKLSIIPPDGAADPVLTESRSGTTTVNSDTHLRIWTAQVPVAGVYGIRTGGDVNGYINPRLAFGHESDYDYLHWVFAAIFGVGLLDVLLSRVFKRMRGGGSPGVGLQDLPTALAPVDPFTPTDQGVRLEQLKTIAALRDSGALTEAEFEAEKRRILKG